MVSITASFGRYKHDSSGAQEDQVRDFAGDHHSKGRAPGVRVPEADSGGRCIL